MALDLTIAIPVHNDRAQLIRLLSHLAALALSQDIIVVDDASLPVLDPDRLAEASGVAPGHLTVLRQDQQRGAGSARNRALLHARRPHILFLDADDLPTRALRALSQSLAQAGAFDFCLFQHHDTRMDRNGLWGQVAWDQRWWIKAGLSHGHLAEIAPAQAQHLVRTANYPWNKIYRTRFLLDHHIRCSDTLVHNDIALHWRSFLRADRMLSSATIGVTHFVHEHGHRLTNRPGSERLAVFEPLDDIALEIVAGTGPDTGIHTKARSPYHPAFFGFALGLLVWIYDILDPSLRADLSQGATAFFARYLTRADRQTLARTWPEDWGRAAARFGWPSPSP